VACSFDRENINLPNLAGLQYVIVTYYHCYVYVTIDIDVDSHGSNVDIDMAYNRYISYIRIHTHIYIYIYLNATVDERHPEPVLETINYERL